MLEGTRSRLGTKSRSRGTAEAYAGLSRTSHLRPQTDPNSFPEPREDIEMRHHKKGSSITGLTTIDSVTGSSDADTGKPPYNVHVTGGPVAEDRDQWDSIATARYGSEERLHLPATGIYKRVEMTHFSEIAK